MSKEIGKKETKRKGRFGTFVFGWIMGFIVNVGILVGLGAFVYFKVSPEWINNTFHTNIDLGSEEVNKKTVKNFIDSAVSLAKNVDTYTLNDLKRDFGVDIGNTLYGINIEDLKDKPLAHITDYLSDKFDTISADELSELIDLSAMESILGDSITYYVRTSGTKTKLYKLIDSKNDTYEEVAFDYEINENVVTINKKDYTINDGKIEPTVKMLPLVNGIADYVDTLGDNLTIGDLQTKFGVQLPSYLSTNEMKQKTINELEDAINDLYVADIMEYTISGDKVYNGTSEVTGVMATVAKKQIKDLDNVMGDINGMTIAEIMDFHKSGNTYYDSNNVAVNDTMQAIADIELQNLKDEINTLKLASFLGYTITGSNVTDKNGNPVGGVMRVIALKQINEMNTIMDTVNSMQLKEVLEFKTVDGVLTDKNGNDLSNVLKAIANTTLEDITDIMSTINNMTIAEILDYTKTATPGIMNAIADIKLGDLSTEIENIQIKDIFDTSTGALSLIDGSTTITNIPNALSNAMSTKTLQDFNDAGLITVTSEDLAKTLTIDSETRTVGSLKLDELVDAFIDLLP